MQARQTKIPYVFVHLQVSACLCCCTSTYTQIQLFLKSRTEMQSRVGFCSGESWIFLKRETHKLPLFSWKFKYKKVASIKLIKLTISINVFWRHYFQIKEYKLWMNSFFLLLLFFGFFFFFPQEEKKKRPFAVFTDFP